MPLPLLAGAAAGAMPLIMAGLRIFLMANIVGFIVRVLAAFGLNFLVVTPAVETVMGLMEGRIAGLPPVAFHWITFLNFHVYVGLILSGYALQQSANFILRINR